ncbi:unnamed protein product [Prunus armeniaca]
MKKVMPSPPAATCLAFHPLDDSIVAICMDNSTIVIYNLHSDELQGSLRVTPKDWVGKIEKQIVADFRWEGVEIIVRYLHPNSPE